MRQFNESTDNKWSVDSLSNETHETHDSLSNETHETHDT